MIRVISILVFLLTYVVSPVIAQSNFALPKVAQKKHVFQPTKPTNSTSENKKEANKKAVFAPVKPEPEKEKPLEQLNDYELQLKASHGNPQAQYLLGRKYVMRGDSTGEELGLNWIRTSAGSGYTKAKDFLKSYRRHW